MTGAATLTHHSATMISGLQPNTIRLHDESDLRREVERAERDGEIAPESRAFDALKQPFGDLDVTQRWRLMQDLLAAERQNPNNFDSLLNNSNFAVSDYYTVRSLTANKPWREEAIKRFVTLVAHGSGGGCSAQESREGIEHLYSDLVNDQPAQERFMSLAVGLQNARAARYAESLFSGPYEDNVAALSRVQGAQSRLGRMLYENTPSWRSIENFRDMQEGQKKGFALAQSAQWIERFIDGGLKSLKHIPHEQKGVVAGTRNAYQSLLEKPGAAPWLDAALQVEEGIAAPIIPGERAVSVADLVAREEDGAKALECYRLLAPVVTPTEGFDKTIEAFSWLKSHSQYAQRFLEYYALGYRTTELIDRFEAEDLQHTVNEPLQPGVRREGDDLIIGGVRVPVRRAL
jgi:hypothetical protein